MSSNSSSTTTSTRCAACKSLRRRCSEDCVLAPYFPSNNPQRFAYVHKIFGASNISKMLQGLPVNDRAKAADCMSIEAELRVQDPVYGCVRHISQLQHQIIMAQRELAQTQGQIAFHSFHYAQAVAAAAAAAAQQPPQGMFLSTTQGQVGHSSSNETSSISNNSMFINGNPYHLHHQRDSTSNTFHLEQQPSAADAAILEDFYPLQDGMM